MKILIYIDSLTFLRGNAGGVRKYAETIKKTIEEEGHTCDWFFETSLKSLNTYDVVHIFSSFYPNLRFFRLASMHLPVVISPIYDPMINNRLPIRALIHASKLPGLLSNHSARKEMTNNADFVFTMSEYEKLRLRRDYNIKFNSANALFPTQDKSLDFRNPKKDLLFIGDIGNPRQNIKRLLEALSNTGLSLTLIGGCSDKKIIKIIERHHNVNYLGYLSDEEKIKEINNHKVFVMPAYTSGFGIGAVEAAEHGLVIVYTKFGGTSNYVNSSAIAVNPYSTSDIRSACIRGVQLHGRKCLIINTKKDLVSNLMRGYIEAIQKYTKRKS